MLLNKYTYRLYNKIKRCYIIPRRVLFANYLLLLVNKNIDMGYTPQHIANYFLNRASDEGRGLSPMKLIKLIYIAYGWYIALTGKKLFDEEIQAWKHGPVIPSIYHEFKHYKSNFIDEDASAFDLDTFKETIPFVSPVDNEVNLILDKVWLAYKDFSGIALRGKTHEEGTPWSKSFESGKRNIVIPDEYIKKHFEHRIKEYINRAQKRDPVIRSIEQHTQQ